MDMFYSNRDINTREKSVLLFLKCVPEGKLISILFAETEFDFCKLCKNKIIEQFSQGRQESILL